jgi:hypothetical protein
MFEDYLNNEQCYIELERYLYDRFFLECKTSELELAKFKAPFYNTTFSDGTPFREGNPIFSVRNEVSGTVLRIVLDEDTDSPVSYRDKHMGCELVIIAKVALLEHITKEMAEWVKSQ